MEKTLKNLVLAVCFFVPFAYFGPSLFLSFTTSKTFLFYGLTEIIFGIWIYKSITDKSYRLAKKDWYFLFPVFLYVFWLTLASFFGFDFKTSFWSNLGRGTGLVSFYHLVAFLIVVISLIKKYGFEKYGKKIINWFIFGSLVLTISIWLGSEGFNLSTVYLENSNGGGLVGNSSLAAPLLILTLFFIAFLFFDKKVSKNKKILLVLFFAFIIFSPIFINLFGNSISARGAFIGIGVGVVASLFFLLLLSENKTKRIFGATLITLGVAGSVYFWNQLESSDTFLYQKFASFSTESRFIFWDIAKQAIKERPVFGFGQENYRIAYQKYFNPKIYTIGESAEVWNDRAHNIYYDNAVAGGYPALVFYLSIFVFLSSILWRSVKNSKLDKNKSITLFGFIVAFLFQGLFVFDSFVSLFSVYLLYAIVVGSSLDESSNIKITKTKNTILASIIILSIAILLFLCVFTPTKKALNITKVVTMPLNFRADHYEELLRGSKVGDSDISPIIESYYKIYHDNRSEIKDDPKILTYALNDLKKLTDYLDKLSSNEKYDARLHLNTARIYLEYIYLSGDRNRELSDKALSYLEKAIDLSPNDPQMYWAKSVLLYQLNDKAKAVESAQKALQIAPYINFSKDLLDKISG